MTLTREAFDALLASLDRDRERAARQYEVVRRRLLKFFEWRGSRCPEELTDETIDRVCRRVAQGEEIRAEEPAAYFYGVARNVLRESWDRERRQSAAWDAAPVQSSGSSGEPEEVERRFECLQRCLGSLPPETRQLILRYYQDQGGAKIDTRRTLADGLGVALNALRIRMHRLRARLETCVRGCLREGSERELAAPPPSREGEHRG